MTIQSSSPRTSLVSVAGAVRRVAAIDARVSDELAAGGPRRFLFAD